MPFISEIACVFRSKNAGPFLITLDLVFPDRGTYHRVLNSGVLNADIVSARYGVEPSDVRIIPFEGVNTIKITLPRWGSSSGAPGDRDVYGAQAHGPLLDLEIP